MNGRGADYSEDDVISTVPRVLKLLSLQDVFPSNLNTLLCLEKEKTSVQCCILLKKRLSIISSLAN